MFNKKILEEILKELKNINLFQKKQIDNSIIFNQELNEKIEKI